MNYNSNCNNYEDKKCCYKIVHEICAYPSYYNEQDFDNKKDMQDKCEHEYNKHNNAQNECNCRKNDGKNYNDYDYDKKDDYNKENNCERKSSRCCCFRRWCW